MWIKAIICAFAFSIFCCTSSAKSIKDLQFDKNGYVNDKCNGYTSGSQGNAKLNCQFTDGQCSVSDKQLQLTEVDLDLSMNNGFNSKGSEYLQLDDNNSQVELYSLSNKERSNYKFCEWRISSNLAGAVTLKINRSTGYHENFWMQAITNSGMRTYKPKDFINGQNEHEFTIKLTNLKSFILKSQILDEESQFSVIVSHTVVKEAKQNENFDWSSTKLIVMGTLVLISGFLNIWLYFFLKHKGSRNDGNIHSPQDLMKRKRKIQNCLASMRSGFYEDINILFDQTSCIMGLEDFNPKDQVSMTNECSHVFHSEGVNRWFNNISMDKEITCPLGISVISDTEKLPSELLEAQPINCTSTNASTDTSIDQTEFQIDTIESN